MHVYVVLLIVLGLVAWFVIRFVRPAVRLEKTLKIAIEKVRQLPQGTSPERVREVFAEDKGLENIWDEFAKTLHEQKDFQDGEYKTVSVFATVTSDAYFNSENILEGRVHSEFFKHLPGILTGLGIIGTFIGLILGLREFAPAIASVGDPASTRAGLAGLMNGVVEAFLVSATAISLAMVITFVEKYGLAQIAQSINDLVLLIDQMYDTGASEDYLARLVKSSEDTSGQTKILKDALLEPISDLLREISQNQISASREVATQIGATISNSIQESLKEPLEKVAGVVQSASGDQSAAATRMLQDVMSHFSQKLSDLFGDQITNINQLNQDTASSLKVAVDSIQKLVGSLEDSGKKTADAMSERMVASLEQLSIRQGEINEQSRLFIEELRKLISQGQSETQSKVLETMSAMQAQLQSMTDSIYTSQQKVYEDNRAREEAMSDRAKGMVSEMTGSVSSAIDEISKASSTISESVSMLSRTTVSSIEKMSAGADRMSIAASDFSAAGDKVNDVLGKSSELIDKLSVSSNAISESADVLKAGLSDYQVQRSSINALLSEIKQTVELAKRDASMTSEVLSKIERATSELSRAEDAAEKYLAQVTDVLTSSHEAFAQELVKTIGVANRDFHRNLQTAVNLLTGTIEELEVTLGGALAKKG